MILKILSFNIWIDGNINQVKNFLQGTNADIIGLQEVEDDDPKRDIIGFLEELGYKYVFAPVKKIWGKDKYNDGPAIFSRFDIVSSKTYLLSQNDTRAAVRVDIKIRNEVLHVFSTHLVHDHQKDSKIQKEQGWNLIKVLNPNQPTIVMGDFNATPTSSTIKAMQRVLEDADPSSMPTWSLFSEGCKICNPKNVSMRLDYIFTSKDIKIKSFQVESSRGSDHLAISALVEI